MTIARPRIGQKAPAAIRNTKARILSRRRHLFEFEDLSWLPHAARDAITDWLQQCVVLEYGVYLSTAPVIADLMEKVDSVELVDLCSGAGGPWPTLKQEVEQSAGPTRLTLTDKFPNIAAFARTSALIGDGRTSYQAQSVDARAVPGDFAGVRTLFTAVHHLRPQLVHDMLRDAFEQRVPIGAFDFCSRDQVGTTLRQGPWRMIRTLNRVPLSRPLKFFTYILPIVPLMIYWDATVSNLRAYSPGDLSILVTDLQAPDWHWETGRLQDVGVTYVTGYPVR